MRRMNRLIPGLLLVLVTTLAACGDAAGEGTEDAYTTLPDGKVVLARSDAETLPPEGDALDGGDVAEEVTEAPPQENGFNYECEPLTVESCVTVCGSAGQRKCLKEWGPCIPPEEFCGNCIDDDCDGLANEGCAPNPACDPVVEPDCPVALIEIAEGTQAWTGDTLHLSAAGSYSPAGEIVQWQWGVQAPAGAQSGFQPSATAKEVTYHVDAAGEYLFSLDVWDDKGTKSCATAQAVVTASTYPPVTPEVGCADGEREGFLDSEAYPHIAGCAGGWDKPGITPDTVKQTCGGKGGDDGDNAEGNGCATADLCAAGWHLCSTWKEVAEKSPTGCAGAVPPGAKPKSIFFAVRQPSENGSVCGEWGDGFNDVFGCGNLGAGLGPDKQCGPLDRVLASTQPNSCGFNEAEPPLGPWECLGGSDSHLNEGALVTKKGCAGTSCSYDGYPIATWDKGGVLCCRD
jgi:hypothetical protein